jgi:glycosyltransferase involved in cell wall biosynthesis
MKLSNATLPLVSVGIPTYNRPEGLRQTLECITNQTYTNLEILISDNASPNSEVEKIARDFVNRDTRVSFYKQNINQGPAFNFKFVLNQAQGKYFMWAADDDKWEPFYIEKLVAELEKSGTSFVAVNFEAQYVDENFVQFEFFAEGAPFYNFQSSQPMDRIKHTLSHNYGNLIYSLYRKEVLDQQNLIFVENEIPFLMQIAEKGNWRVLPEIGFYKKTVHSTYLQACWEMSGGGLPRSLRVPAQAMPSLTSYHRVALENIIKAINTLNINANERGLLRQLATKLIWRHWFWLLLGYKPKTS